MHILNKCLIFILLYIIISYNDHLWAQSSVTVDLHDQSTETFQVSANGKIQCENSLLKILTDVNSTTISIPLTSIRKISFASLSSSNEIASTSGITVFPNPADHNIIIMDGTRQSLEFSLISILGRQVFAGKLTNGQRFSVSDWSRVYTW